MLEPAEEEEPSWIPLHDYFSKLYRTYDGPFLLLLGTQCVNHGLWSVAVLATQDLFKTYHKLDPGQMAMYMSIVHLPWSVKIVYGLLSDNVKFCGTRRKSYLVLMGCLQFFALMVIAAQDNLPSMAVALSLMMAALSEAFVNVVADAIMCVQARRDPESGSQDLITFSWMMSGIGGIFGSFFGGYMTQYYHPRYSFFAYAFMGIVVAAIGSMLNPESETDPDQPVEDEEVGFLEKFGQNLGEILSAVLMPEMYLVVLYFVIGGFLCPDFGDFGYYFYLNTVGISKFQYSMLGTIGQFTSIFGTMWYEKSLKNVEVRTVLYWSTLLSCFAAFCSFFFAKRWNISMGINDMAFIIVTDTIFGVISLAMNTLPTLALFAKITPVGIEGTIFAFLTGTFNLSNNVFSPLIGAWVNDKFVHVTADDLSGYPKLQLISFALSFLALPLVYLIPTKADIEKWQGQRKEL